MVICGFSGGATSAVALAARLSENGVEVLHVVVDSGIPGSEPPGPVPVTVLHYDDPQEYWEGDFKRHWQGFNATLIAHQSGHAQGLYQVRLGLTGPVIGSRFGLGQLVGTGRQRSMGFSSNFRHVSGAAG